MIKILLYAAAADCVGAPSIVYEPDGDASVGAMLDWLAAAHPQAGDLLGRSAVAVNEKYAPRSTPIGPGDTVAIIPPVSGG